VTLSGPQVAKKLAPRHFIGFDVDAVQLRVDPFDTVDHRFHQLDGIDFLLANEISQSEGIILVKILDYSCLTGSLAESAN
jgi:hypothetical protein